MKKLFTLILTLFACGLTFNTTAQQANYSQYFSNPLYLNPAYAGSAKCSQFAAQYRYGGFFGSFGLDQAVTTSYDQPVGKSSAVGVQFTYESLYEISIENFSLDAIYAHNFKLNEDLSITPGLSLGIFRQQINWERFIFQDQILTYGSSIFLLTAPNNLVTVFDIKFGFITKYKNLSIGASLDHLNEPKFSYYEEDKTSELNGRLFLHADYLAKINDRLVIRPGFVVSKYIHGLKSIYLPSLRFEFVRLSLGAATRVYNGEVVSLIGMAGYTAKRIGGMVSYDLNYSKYMSHNSLELTAYYRFACK